MHVQLEPGYLKTWLSQTELLNKKKIPLDGQTRQANLSSKLVNLCSAWRLLKPLKYYHVVYPREHMMPVPDSGEFKTSLSEQYNCLPAENFNETPLILSHLLSAIPIPQHLKLST